MEPFPVRVVFDGSSTTTWTLFTATGDSLESGSESRDCGG
jgi:hypothetical protein